MSNPGDLLILGNSGVTAAVPNAGTNLDLVWDNTVQSLGLSSGDASVDGHISLGAGRYFIMYSEYFNTSDTTNNERVEIQGEIHTVSGGLQGGFGQGMIRKASNDQDAVVRGQMILTLTGTEEIFVRTYRTDNSTSGTVNRVVNRGSLVILQLDETDDFGLYSKSATQSLTAATTSTVSFPTTDIQDANFAIASNVVTVTAAGRYLVTYSLDINQGTATGREDVISYLRNAGAEITGTRGFCYMRGSDGLQDGALTWVGILDLPAGATIDLRAQCPTSATINITQGTLQFWQLPATADTIIMEATNGNYNAAGPFQFDTVEQIDTAEFTATGATDTITLDNGNAYLMFATLSQIAPDTVQRAVPRLQFQVAGGSQILGVGDGYHRASGGTGYLAINVGAAWYFEDVATDIQLGITITAATGALTNDLGQFSVLSLASIYGNYVPPPLITDFDGDNQVTIGQTNVVANGARFGSVQGTGKLEMWSDLVGTIKVVQTIDTWSDTSIQFDFVQGGLTDNTTIYAVVTDDGGAESPPRAVFLGIPPLDDYFTILANENPDHWWRLNNDAYADSAGANPITSSVISGGGAFEATPICEQNTHSWRVQGGAGARRECANSNNMNTQIKTARTMAGWIRVGGVDPALSCIYEEGGGINNVTLLLGMGNILTASYADTGDDNAQAYSNKPLEPGRDYFYAWTFDHTASVKEFRLWLDGVKQDVTSGNPLTSGNLDAHSGDISFGGPGGNLEVGGTDVLFRTQLDTYYANWASWTRELTPAQILELFQRGARPVRTIASDTVANMQTAVDAFASTTFPNEAHSLRIFETTDGARLLENVSLDLDGIVFDEDTSIQVEWRGAGTLTLTNLNGANVDASKCISTRGGNVVVVNPAQLTLTGLQNPTEVRVYEAGTQNEVAGQENVTTGTFNATIQTSAVDIVIAALQYQNIRLLNVDTTSDISLPIQQRFDRNYENP